MSAGSPISPTPLRPSSPPLRPPSPLRTNERYTADGWSKVEVEREKEQNLLQVIIAVLTEPHYYDKYTKG